MIFNRGIDTVKITELSKHKPGILNNYIRMSDVVHSNWMGLNLRVIIKIIPDILLEVVFDL